MIRLISKGVYAEEDVEKAIEIFKKLQVESIKEEGCISYQLCKEINDKTILTMVEDWDSMEIIEKHRNTEHFKTLVPELGKLKKSGELNLYEIVF